MRRDSLGQRGVDGNSSTKKGSGVGGVDTVGNLEDEVTWSAMVVGVSTERARSLCLLLPLVLSSVSSGLSLVTVGLAVILALTTLKARIVLGSDLKEERSLAKNDEEVEIDDDSRRETALTPTMSPTLTCLTSDPTRTASPTISCPTTCYHELWSVFDFFAPYESGADLLEGSSPPPSLYIVCKRQRSGLAEEREESKRIRIEARIRQRKWTHLQT